MTGLQGVSRVLVTGGAGFVGANLVRALLADGFLVTILDNLRVGRREYLEGLPADLIQADILDVTAVREAVAGHEAVVHLAAQTGVPGSLADPRRDCETNVIGTLNVLEACRKAGVRRFVFASSNAPLGRQKPPATEDKAPLPISPYGASKLAGEAYCLAYHGSWALGTVALRFGNVYGPFSAHKNSVVAKFFKDILTKGEIRVDGDGYQTRDFIFVNDVCAAVIRALRSSVQGEIFQIATGKETSILDLASRIQQLAGKDASIQHGAPRLGDIRENYAAIAKAAGQLKWKPQTELNEGLRSTLEWFRGPHTGGLRHTLTP